MGIAQEHQLDGGIGRFPFQILRIQRISAVLIFQRAGFLQRIRYCGWRKKKQLYTGVCTSTLSPGTVRARMTADSAGTTPVV